jgi:hypothetical protein
MFDREMEQWHTGCPEGVIEELVSRLPARRLVAGIIQFHDELHRQVVRIAQDEIDVLALNAVECLLPGACTQAGLHFDDIREADFAEDPELSFNGLLQHAEK